MNSSGIKRGLAATAVAAMAVTGLPFLASSASADSGDTWSQIAGGPVRDGNAAGGSVILKSSSNSIDGSIYVTKSDFSGALGAGTAVGGGPQIQSSAFDVDVQSVTLLDGNAPTTPLVMDKFPDGTYHYEAITAVTLGTASKATFGLVEDADASGAVNASDPKTVVEVTPTGAPASVTVSPSTQTTAVNVASPDYTVQVKDAAGNLTQLVSGEAFGVTATGTGTTTPTGTLDDTTLDDGVATFTATPDAPGTKSLVIKGNGTGATPATLATSATLTAVAQADIDEDEFDLATGADTWKSTSVFGDPTQVRVDQDAVTFNFASSDLDNDGAPDDANTVVMLTLSSATLKFDGKGTQVYPVALDSAGKGSLTVKPTGIVDGAKFTFASTGSNITSTEVTFKRAAATSVTSAKAYVTKVGSPTDVTVTVKDQFGNATGAPAQVAIVRGARNGSTTTARQTVNESGQATFTLPDAGTTAGAEVFTINLYDDQFDGSETSFTGGTINYTADGLGPDFIVNGATVDAAATKIIPLYDSAAGVGDSAAITVAGGVPNGTAKVTVDGGALVLSGGTDLTKGAASQTVNLNATGDATFTVVGTKFGVVNVTIESGGRTKSVKLTVTPPATASDVVKTARNIALVGPEKANAGSVASFTATVTDAFGNPVPGVPAASLQIGVSGPADAQGSDAVTDANGKFNFDVILTDNADSAVTVKVTGVDNAGKTPQFGKAANTLSVANDAPGLTASSNVATAKITDVVNIEELQAAVDAAQAKVDNAQDSLAAARGDLQVAKAERSVARQAVRQAKRELRQAKRHHKGVKQARKDLREARGDLRIARAKVDAAQATVNRAIERLEAAQAELAAAEQALADAQS